MSAHDSDYKKDRLHEEMSYICSLAKRQFKEHCLVTIIMRNPENIESELVIGDDGDFDAIVAVLNRSKNRTSVK